MSQYVLQRIQAIQDELENLKKIISYQPEKYPSQTKIKGLWKGIIISDEDLENAKKAVFKTIVDWEN